jgi:hypothetical protein
MRRPGLSVLALSVFVLFTTALAAAQRHNGGSSPPTAPPPKPTTPAPALVVAVSSGLGALQFVAVNYGVPAPQSLTRQLQADDDRTRAASLSAIGAPGQYTVRGHIPFPRSVDLIFVALGTTDELDAILTVELDQHMVSAILLPQDGTWHRIATFVYPIPFSDTGETPATFLRVARSLQQHEHYTAIFHATANGPNGSSTENEAQLRVLNNRAVVTISFASGERTCDAHTHACELVRRWLQSDPADPLHHFTLVSATGHLSPREATDPLATARTYQYTHLRTFTCQPFTFSEPSGHYEPTANPKPCTTGR